MLPGANNRKLTAAAADALTKSTKYLTTYNFTIPTVLAPPYKKIDLQVVVEFFSGLGFHSPREVKLDLNAHRLSLSHCKDRGINRQSLVLHTCNMIWEKLSITLVTISSTLPQYSKGYCFYCCQHYECYYSKYI